MKRFILLAIIVQLGVITFTYNNPSHPMVYHYTKDLDLWYGMFENISKGQIPMVDFGIEYPAGTVLLYWLLYPFRQQFLVFHSLFMLAVFIVSLIYLYRLIPHSKWITALYILSPTVLILNHVRFDIVPVALTLAGFYYYKKGRLYLPCILFGLGTSMKWFPAFMVIAIAWEELFINKKFLKAFKLCIISLIFYMLPDSIFIITSLIRHGNINNWLFSFSANANLSIYTDTIPGLIRIFYGKELATYLPLYIMGGLFLIITIIPYPKSSLPRYILYCFSFLVFNKIYSPQFHMWFLPFLLLFIGQSRYPKSGFIAVILLELINISIYPFSFSIILSKLRFFELGPLFPIPGFRIFTWGIIIRAIILLSLALYIYSKKRLPLYLSIVSLIIPFFYYKGIDNTVDKRLAHIYRAIPKGSEIATDNTLYPYIKTRFPTTFYTMDSEPGYILLNTSPNIPYTRRVCYKKMLKNLLDSKRYGVKRFDRECILLEKDGPTRYNDSIVRKILNIFEAEYMPGTIGKKIKDPGAVNRFSKIGSKNTESGHLVYGPYIPLPPGEYSVSYRLKTSEDRPEELIARIDVAGKMGQEIYAERDIYAMDFKRKNIYQSFRLDFKLPEFDRIEFRVYLTGNGDLTIDRIRLHNEIH